MGHSFAHPAVDMHSVRGRNWSHQNVGQTGRSHRQADRKPGSYPESMATVCSIESLPASDIDALFAATEVGDVWRVGRRIGKQFNDSGVHTVLDLARLNPSMVRGR